jgi:hypothetical protein
MIALSKAANRRRGGRGSSRTRRGQPSVRRPLEGALARDERYDQRCDGYEQKERGEQ